MIDNQHPDTSPATEFSWNHLGNYRLIRPLGQGTFATVYLGEHLYLKRPAAIKVLRTVLAEQEQAHFLKEARLLAGLSHPHIVRVLEFAVAQRWKTFLNIRMIERLPFLVMDYAPGGSLRAAYPRNTCLPLVKVVQIIQQASAGLQYAHERKVIHRDIKPENLLINERREVMLSDFGLALMVPPFDFLSLQGVAGTLSYAAPEQLQGRPTFASDQYSLGIIAYEWLCGSLPFVGNDIEILLQHVSSPPPPLRSKNPSIPQAVEDVILRSLAKEPRQRYATVQAFAQALEEASQIRTPRPITRQIRIVTVAPAAEEQRVLPPNNLAPAAARALTDQNPRRPEPVAGISSTMRQNRLRMIRKMRAFWIKGVLEHSLHDTPFIMPGLDERWDIVASAWSPGAHTADERARSLPPDTPITNAYDRASGELLLLGEAGTGKTTLLLELARHLLDRAEQDEAAPLPVIFVLSSWSEKQLPLEGWLIEELHNKYQVPRPLGEMWVRNEMLAPLLDGLDEVAEDARSACVVAINAYKKEHGLGSLVVCSRLKDYLLFPPRVLLQSAVVVRPLTMPQVKDYLTRAGKGSESIYQLLLQDPALQHLATTPLMLHVITVAYANKSPQEFLAMMYSHGERYQRLFSTYVEQMLHHRPTQDSHLLHQLTGTLSYLARHMQQHGQRVFYMEQMQPDWIEQNRWNHFYKWCAVILPGILIGALTGILSNALIFHASSIGVIAMDAVYGSIIGYMFSSRQTDTTFSRRPPTLTGDPEKPFLKRRYFTAILLVGLITFLCIASAKGWHAGLANGIFLGVLSLPLNIIFDEYRKTSQDARSSPKNWRTSLLFKHLRNGMLIGTACGITSVITLLVNQSGDSFIFLLSLGLRDSLRNTLLGTLLSALLFNSDGLIHRAEVVSWSWKAFWSSIMGQRKIVYDLLIGVAVGIIFASKQLFQGNMGMVASAGLSTGLLVALSIRLVYAVLHSISSRNLDDRNRFKVNEGIRRSLFHGLVGGMIGAFLTLFFSVITTVISAVASSGLFSLHKGSLLLANIGLGLSNALLLVPVGGLLVWLLLGGLAFSQYRCLLFVLQREGSIPRRLVSILDYAVDCVFLYRVGGGYIFIHRLLQEYFASLDDKDKER